MSDSRTQYEAHDGDEWAPITKAERAQIGSGRWKVWWVDSKWKPTEGISEEKVRVRVDVGGKGGKGEVMDKELREVVDGYAKQLSNSRQELSGFSWDKVFGMEHIKRELQGFGAEYGDPEKVGIKAADRCFLLYG